MTAGSQHLQLYSTMPDTSCTQKIKPIVLKQDFSHTDLALQIPHMPQSFIAILSVSPEDIKHKKP